MNTIQKVFQEGNTVVIKVGSNVLAGDTDGMNLENMQNIVNGIHYLASIGMNVFLITSGAVAVGRNICEKKGIIFGNKVDEKALLAGIGQQKLISMYGKLFEEKNIIITQNLITHNNISNKTERENIADVWKLGTNNKIVSIINENDVVSREELGFSDNDELAGLVAKTLQADALILLSNINGLYENYGTQEQKLIPLVYDISQIEKHCSDSKSSMGTGGMNSKITVMQKMMDIKTTGVIANGGEKNILQRLAQGEPKGTVFVEKSS